MANWLICHAICFFCFGSDKVGTQQDYDSAVYGATAKERPFVHVFVVQESMKLDSLQSVSVVQSMC